MLIEKLSPFETGQKAEREPAPRAGIFGVAHR
jgi:hypothetical protein